MLTRPPDDDDRKRQQRRARDRQRYRREAAGLAVAPVEYSRAMVGYLIRWHWLAQCDADNREKVGAAISRALQEAADADEK